MGERGGRLVGKVAVLVGAGQTPGETIGNGRATAIRFAQEGAHLLLVDRDEASAPVTLEMVAEHAAGGVEAAVHGADITDDESCAGIVEACVDRFGRLDVLHNNVGVGAGDDRVDVTVYQFVAGSQHADDRKTRFTL